MTRTLGINMKILYSIVLIAISATGVTLGDNLVRVLKLLCWIDADCGESDRSYLAMGREARLRALPSHSILRCFGVSVLRNLDRALVRV